LYGYSSPDTDVEIRPRRLTLALLAVLSLVMLAIVAASASAKPPTGDFTVSPNPPNEDQAATFACDPCPEGADVAWDFDGNLDFTDARGTTAQHTFGDAGPVTVTMRLTKDREVGSVAHDFTVNAPPVVDFDSSPDSPLPNQDVLFSVTANTEPGVALEWDFGDGRTSSQSGPRHSYANPGQYAVQLTATDAGGLKGTQTRQVIVQDPSGPAAALSFAPMVPLVGQVVTFTDTSTPSSGQSITSREWDLDNDGDFDDSPVGWSFGAPGNHVVSLLVTQSNDKPALKRLNIRVNAAPTAAFVWSPLMPVARQAINLVSISGDSEGVLSGQAWDLDGDGQYDDASGSAVSRAFPSAGNYAVGLQVTDSDGVVRTIRRVVTVSAAAIVPAASVRFMAPFPVVRLAGKVLPRGALVRLLVVRAPRGSLIRVKCGEKGCPVRAVRRTSGGRGVRFAQFERRLRAGISLELFIRKPGMIGKYTRFRIRAGAPPKRVDLCLFPSRRAPRRCP
jgi:PKD repeat protein